MRAYKGVQPSLGANCYIDESSVVVGDVVP